MSRNEVNKHMQKTYLSDSPIHNVACGIFSMFAIMLLVFSVQVKDVRADDTSVMAKLAGQSMLLDGFSKEGLMTMVGERGHVLVSSDGKNWQQVIVPTRTTLTGVYFYDNQYGWIVGHDAVILRTTDGGKHWQKVYDDPEGETPLLDVWFRDEKRGIAIGAYGLYLVSEDGGENWNISELNVNVNKTANDTDENENRAEDDDDFIDSYDLHLNSIALADNGKLYIAAEAGKIYRSDDFGTSWMPLASPYIGSLFGVLPLEGDTVLAFGLRGHLFRSEDAGENWQEIKTPTQEMLTNGYAIKDDEIYITGLGGTILKSNDKGQSFVLQEQGHRDGFTAIIKSPEGELIIVGEKGVSLLQ
jgi:photosystem II stability/assembly factor-like uncharacterized protein